MATGRETICPTNPKQPKVLLKVLFPDFQMPFAVTLPFTGSTTVLMHVCVGRCLDRVCLTLYVIIYVIICQTQVVKYHKLSVYGTVKSKKTCKHIKFALTVKQVKLGIKACL